MDTCAGGAPSHAHLYSCRVGGERVTSHVLSCGPAEADATKAVHAHAREAAGAAADAPCECDYITRVPVGDGAAAPAAAAAPEVEDRRWMEKRMARSCGPDFNPNHALSHNHFTCRYVGEGVVDGKVVSNPFKTWTGRLASCAEDGLGISEDLMRDVRDYVYAAADGDAFELDRDKFVCDVTTIPQL